MIELNGFVDDIGFIANFKILQDHLQIIEVDAFDIDFPKKKQ